MVRLGYENGGLTLGMQYHIGRGTKFTMSFIESTHNAVERYPLLSWVSMSFGMVLTYGMMLVRSRFASFPLHPVGYMVCITSPAFYLWFSIFVAWLLKVLVTRFAGHDGYRKTVPLFLGLALGDVVMILFWLVIDGWQGRVTHSLLP
jgi:hypothetical protein